MVKFKPSCFYLHNKMEGLLFVLMKNSRRELLRNEDKKLLDLLSLFKVLLSPSNSIVKGWIIFPWKENGIFSDGSGIYITGGGVMELLALFLGREGVIGQKYR